MDRKLTRLLALALCAVLALSLVVPALAAVPVMEESEAVAEVAPADDCHDHEAHSHGTTVERPAVSESEEAPVALLAEEAHTHNFADGLPDSGSFFSTTGSLKSSVTAVTANIGSGDQSFTGALKMNSSGTCSFTATGTGTLTLVLGHAKSDYTFKLDGAVQSYTNHVFTTELSAGTHTIAQNSGEGYLYYISFGSTCTHESTESVAAVAATCGTVGYTAGVKCRSCGAIISGCEEIPATGNHTWVEGADTATCNAGGQRVDTCSVCHLTRTVNTSATSKHTYTGNGHICSVCGWDNEQKTYHAHVWVEDTSKRVAASCTATGTAYYTCSSCGATRTETIAKTAHNYGSDGKCTVCGAEKPNSSFMKQAGDQESAYIEWPIGEGVGKYTVFVKEKSAASWTPLDDQLVRQYPGYMRADALGLEGNKTYQMKVVADNDESTAMVTGDLEVLAHERTGFGFVNGTSSGAYNDDGTLKTGAKVVYVDNSNFDTVQLTVGGTTYTGVQAIVDSSGVAKNSPGTPVCIRVLGTIDTTGFPKGSWGSSAEGLQIKGNKTEQDKTLTIEGVGNDAVFSGFGMLIRSCSNVEIRNLGFLNFADDGVSIDTDNRYLWVHNCDFFYGNPGGDSDQAKGDGSLDAKASFYCTFSYNHFWDSGKCILLGMHNPQDNMTYHHNWFDHSDSRHPRIRIAQSVHIYNNYYDGNAKYGVGAAENSGAFVEANYFRDCKYPMLSSMQGSDISGGSGGTFSSEDGGVIKAYGNYITGAKAYVTYQQNNTEFDAYEASSRDEKVPSTVKAKQGGTTYSNFDTAGDIGVTADQVQTAEAARETVIAWAGRVEGGDLQYKFDEATQHWSAGDAVAAAVIPELKALVTGYETKLVKVGGTVDSSVQPAEHVHNFGEWTVTQQADCANGTPQIETRYCVNGTCPTGEKETRTTAASHSYVNGVCANCGAKEEATGGSTGGTTSANSKVFKGTDFADGTPKTSISDTIASKYNGYFSLYGDSTLVQRGASSTTDPVVNFIKIPVGAGAGVQFTTQSTVQVTVKCSSTSKSGKSSTMQLVKVDGATLTPVASTANATSTTVTKNVSDATAVSFVLDAGGTYAVLATADSANEVRLTELTVAETESGGTTSCVHSSSSWVTVTPAACGVSGLRQKKCDVCGEVLETETIEALEHKWSVYALNDSGHVVQTCSVCDAETDHGAGGYLGAAESGLLYSNKSGAVTVYNAIPTDNKVMVSYWNGTRFLGVRILETVEDLTVPITGWTSIRLFWLDDGVRPMCAAVDISQ